MSRSFALVAALVVSFGCGDASFAQENPAAGGLGGGGLRGGCWWRRARRSAPPRHDRRGGRARAARRLPRPSWKPRCGSPRSSTLPRRPLGRRRLRGQPVDINVQIDRKSLADAAVDLSAPVTISLRKPIPLESALHLILGEFDLTFTIQDDVLKILNKEQADEILTTKVYAVSDLLDRGPRRTLRRCIGQ